MKNIVSNLGVKLVSMVAFVFLAGTAQLKAQTTEKEKQIEGVTLSQSPITKIVNDKIDQQFDFTSLNDVVTGQSYFSKVKFTVLENGKVSNVSANGENQSVDKELTNVVSHLNLKKYKGVDASNYVLPVTIKVE